MIQPLVSKYEDKAREIVQVANEKLLTKQSKINSDDIINDIKFKILERWKEINSKMF